MPQNYVCPETPILWDIPNVDIGSFPETPMHLLFLGITKALIHSVIHVYLTKIARKTAFLRSIKGLLTSVAGLKLEWCKALDFSNDGSTGAMVSENYMACARLMCWIFSTIPQVETGNSGYIYSNPDPNKWGKVDNYHWLKERGQNCKGNAAELKERVKKLMDKQINDDHPQQSSLTEDSGYVQDVLKSWTSAVSLLMAVIIDKAHINNVRLHIKIFLDCFVQYDKTLMKTTHQHTETWISKYNFASLPNVVQILREYGSLRNIWEGDFKGEALISIVKPETFGAYRGNNIKNPSFNIIRRVYKKMAVHRLRYRITERQVLDHPPADEELVMTTTVDYNDEAGENDFSQESLSSDLDHPHQDDDSYQHDCGDDGNSSATSDESEVNKVEHTVPEKPDASSLKSNVHLYRRWGDINHSFCSRLPISCMVFLDHSLSKKIINVMAITRYMDYYSFHPEPGNAAIEHMGLRYVKWQLVDKPAVEDADFVKNMSSNRHYGLLLPLLVNNTSDNDRSNKSTSINGDAIFTLILSNWKVLQPEHTADWPFFKGK
jgi:hypothetical protein